MCAGESVVYILESGFRSMSKRQLFFRQRRVCMKIVRGVSCGSETVVNCFSETIFVDTHSI